MEFLRNDYIGSFLKIKNFSSIVDEEKTKQKNENGMKICQHLQIFVTKCFQENRFG